MQQSINACARAHAWSGFSSIKAHLLPVKSPLCFWCYMQSRIIVPRDAEHQTQLLPSTLQQEASVSN